MATIPAQVGPRILVIEGRLQHRDQLMGRLFDEGHEVIAVADWVQATALSSKISFDLVLISVPSDAVFDGWLAQLRYHLSHACIAAIAEIPESHCLRYLRDLHRYFDAVMYQYDGQSFVWEDVLDMVARCVSVQPLLADKGQDSRAQFSPTIDNLVALLNPPSVAGEAMVENPQAYLPTLTQSSPSRTVLSGSLPCLSMLSDLVGCVGAFIADMASAEILRSVGKEVCPDTVDFGRELLRMALLFRESPERHFEDVVTTLGETCFVVSQVGENAFCCVILERAEGSIAHARWKLRDLGRKHAAQQMLQQLRPSNTHLDALLHP